MALQTRKQNTTKSDQEIEEAIKKGKSFLLDAGAGSGKTSSLIRALTLLRSDFRNDMLTKRQHVACITYTNVAKNEIIERTEFDELIEVNTIHEFLWAQIKPYQKELQQSVIRYNASLPSESRRRCDENELSISMKKDLQNITYSEFGTNLIEGRLHHDDVIAVSKIMFEDNSFLCRLIASRYPFIFVDEYQDTDPRVIDILLDCIASSPPVTVIGFFGDKKQSIYDGVVGEMDANRKKQLQLITKEENYRCANTVINLLNKLRKDIKQYPAGNNAEGATVYVGLTQDDKNPQDAYEVVRGQLVDAPNYSEAKVLYLTHRLIAKEAGYSKLFNCYQKQSNYKKDAFNKGEETVAKFLAFELDSLIYNWSAGNTASVLSLLWKKGMHLQSLAHKSEIKSSLDTLVCLFEDNIALGKLLDHVTETNLLEFPDVLSEAQALAKKPLDEVDEEDRNIKQFAIDLFEIPCKEIRCYRERLEDIGPYTTKHGVKGDEFDTVIVILDDSGARWKNYSFDKFLQDAEKNETRRRRTINLLYVCCSRAKTNLVVIDRGFTQDRLGNVQTYFGENNVVII